MLDDICLCDHDYVGSYMCEASNDSHVIQLVGMQVLMGRLSASRNAEEQLLLASYHSAHIVHHACDLHLVGAENPGKRA